MGWAAPLSAVAGEDQDPQAIRAAVQSAANQSAPLPDGTVDVEVGAIDPRLHFPACPALQVSLPPVDSAMLTARVSCAVPTWTLFVPVRIHVWRRAVVAAADLAPNTKLTGADLSSARIDFFAGNGGYLTDPAQAEGKVLRANIRAGAPIPAALLDMPVIVHRGESILLTLLDITISIKTTVIAMEDGKAGDDILVQNPDSKKTVRATVTNPGNVEMRFGEATR